MGRALRIFHYKLIELVKMDLVVAVNDLRRILQKLRLLSMQCSRRQALEADSFLKTCLIEILSFEGDCFVRSELYIRSLVQSCRSSRVDVGVEIVFLILFIG